MSEIRATMAKQLRDSLNGPIAVLAGGNSAEREISLRSGNAVLEALVGLGLPCELVDTAQKNWLEKIADFGLAFIALHGPGGEDGTVQGALLSKGVRFTGSAVLASALAMDKRRSKLLWMGAGLPTPDFELLDESSNLEAVFARLGECIVKPSNEGSSIGMARVSSEAELCEAYAQAKNYGTVLAERWVVGKEYTVAIVGREVLPAIRLETDNRFYDFDAKYTSTATRYICPCGLPPAEESALQELALQAFDSLGCEGWGRVDVMCTEQGEFQLLEVNTIPGMTDHSLVPMAAKAKGWDFQELVLAIAVQAL